MPNTNPSRPQSDTKPQSAVPVAYARAWVFEPSIKRGSKLYAVTLHQALSDDVPLYPQSEIDALRDRVLVLTVALTRAMSLMEADLSDTTGPIMREMAEQARAALRGQS